MVTEHQFDDIRWTYFSKHDNNLYVVDYLKIKKVAPGGDVLIIADDLKESNIPYMYMAYQTCHPGPVTSLLGFPSHTEIVNLV